MTDSTRSCSTPPAPAAQQQQQQQRPNILVIWGDDIGWFNISAYNHGMMGYQTPNLDRIAREGVLFTDWYGQQSCTAGRAAFVTGQSPIRTGLLKVGLPGAKEGIIEEDPTIATALKDLGYATGQFGKNHLGDRNEYLPTVHGFDEYAGVLYHLKDLRTSGRPCVDFRFFGPILRPYQEDVIDRAIREGHGIIDIGTGGGAAAAGGEDRPVKRGSADDAAFIMQNAGSVIIDHGDGYMSLYGQNQALYKEVGEWVDMGEVVAALGASGGQAKAVIAEGQVLVNGNTETQKRKKIVAGDTIEFNGQKIAIQLASIVAAEADAKKQAIEETNGDSVAIRPENK